MVGLDDLVAICQIGLEGEAKLELARNYWDEMGRGHLADVHTELHKDLTSALDLQPIPRRQQPLESLERTALSTLFATNRTWQPEMVGALGLIELQAGPHVERWRPASVVWGPTNGHCRSTTNTHRLTRSTAGIGWRT